MHQGDVRGLWINLRKGVAIAEFLGLHRSMYTVSVSQSHMQPIDPRVAIFEALCAVDRMVSMMFGLPVGTSMYELPEKQIIDQYGHLSLYGYMFNLTKIAMEVQHIDEVLASGRPYIEVYQNILQADNKLLALDSKIPQLWVPVQHLEPRYLPQTMQSYLTVRVHLYSIMHPQAQFAYSWQRCIETCQTYGKRFLVLRPLLPGAFFLTRIFQIQAFTVSIVLLLSYERKSAMLGSIASSLFDQSLGLVADIIEDLEKGSTQSPAEFATQAAAALRSLQSWLITPDTLASDTLTLRVPTLGKMLIRRTARSNPAPAVPNGLHAQHSLVQNDITEAGPHLGALESAISAPPERRDSLSWLLELDVNGLGDDSLFSAVFNDII